MEEESTEEYLIFEKFKSLDDAGPLMALLESAGIEYWVDEVFPAMDITFTGNILDKEYHIKIKEMDFHNANLASEAHAAEIMADISSDYFLFDFSDKELLELIEKYDQWSMEDFVLARKILEERGYTLTDQHIEELRQNRIAELRKPDKMSVKWIVIGFAVAIFGGLPGIVIGWFYMTSKKTDPIGKRVYAYDEESRKYAAAIFGFGLFSFFVWCLEDFILCF